MNGVTDHAFRHIQKKYGNPMLLYTEFTSVDGICAGASALLKDFLYDESQRPIIAQVYGRHPHNFYQTAILLCQLGFDGIDINMGCPSRSIVHAGSGAGLIRTPDLAKQIVRATQRGVQDWLNGATVRDCKEIPAALAAEIEVRHRRLPAEYRQRHPVPVSIKTRIGYESCQVDAWIPQLLECAPAAISIHGRTLTQGYAGEADWDAIGRAGQIARDSGTPILGNGDILSPADARQRIAGYGLAGALIGRASYGNPYVFRQEECPTQRQPDDRGSTSLQEQLNSRYDILQIALDHARFYEQSFAHLEKYRFLPMRKHLGWYVRHVPGASHLRRELTQASSLGEAVGVINGYLDYRRGWENEVRVQ